MSHAQQDRATPLIFNAKDERDRVCLQPMSNGILDRFQNRLGVSNRTTVRVELQSQVHGCRCQVVVVGSCVKTVTLRDGIQAIILSHIVSTSKDTSKIH